MHARDCPNIKRIIKPVQPHQPLGGVGNSARHRRCTDAFQHAQELRRAGALLPRRAEPARHVRRRPQPVAVQRLKGLLEKLPTKWERLNARARPALQCQVAMRCCAASTSGRGRHLTMRACSTLNKQRREADVLRCVRRCQRGEYGFAPQCRDRPLPLHARELFDDAQLTALSNPLRAEQLGGRQRRRQRRRARSAQGRPATCRRKDARAPAPFRRASAPSFALRPSRPHRRRRRHCRGRLAVCSASRRRRRQPQEPRPQPSRLDARASCVRSSTSPSSPLPASRPTSPRRGCGSRRSQPRALSSWRARRRRRRHRRHSSSEQ